MTDCHPLARAKFRRCRRRRSSVRPLFRSSGKYRLSQSKYSHPSLRVLAHLVPPTLKSKNRINGEYSKRFFRVTLADFYLDPVALSRAREGLYILGNAIDLKTKSSMWNDVISELEQRGCVGDAIPVRCHRHSERMEYISKAGQLARISPDGTHILSRWVCSLS